MGSWRWLTWPVLVVLGLGALAGVALVGLDSSARHLEDHVLPALLASGDARCSLGCARAFWDTAAPGGHPAAAAAVGGALEACGLALASLAAALAEHPQSAPGPAAAPPEPAEVEPLRLALGGLQRRIGRVQTSPGSDQSEERDRIGSDLASLERGLLGLVRRLGEHGEEHVRLRQGRFVALALVGLGLIPLAAWLVARAGREQQRQALALSASEERFHRLFSTMQEGMALHEVVLDPAGRPIDYVLIDVNPSYEAITGIHRDRAIGRRASEVYGTPNPPYLEEFAGVALSGQPTRLNVYFAPLEKHFDISVHSPGPGQFATVFTDVSQREHDAVALRASERRYRLLFAALVQGVVHLDAAGRIDEANPAAERILGRSLADMQGLAPADEGWRAQREDGSPFLAGQHPSSIALREGRVVGEVAMGVWNPRGQEWRWLQVGAVPEMGGEIGPAAAVAGAATAAGGGTGPAGHPAATSVRPVGVFASFADITEQRRLADELRRTRDEWEAIFQAIGQPTLVLDPQQTILAANRAVVARLGLSVEELVGRPCFEVFHGPGAGGPPACCPFARMLAGSTLATVEMEVEAFGGVFMVTCTPILDGQGRLVKIIHIASEVTGLRRAEVEAARLAGDLERRVAERTSALEEARGELEAFTHAVAHDLRSPLRHVTGFAGLLEREEGERLSAFGRQRLAAIATAGRQLGQLVDGLLAFARLGRTKLQWEEVALRPLLDEVWSALGPARGERAVRFTVGDLPVVTGDSGLLRQALLELLDNALKFTAERAVAEIAVAVGRDPEGWQVSVRDNGCGFAMAHVDQLFSVFTRLHREDQAGGLGIGLALVRRIVERHGGRVWAEGTPGEGATVHLLLPVTPPAAGPVEAVG